MIMQRSNMQRYLAGLPARDHVPDFFVRLTCGDGRLVDVRPAHRPPTRRPHLRRARPRHLLQHAAPHLRGEMVERPAPYAVSFADRVERLAIVVALTAVVELEVHEGGQPPR